MSEIQDALWEAALTAVKTLPKGTGSTSHDAGTFVKAGPADEITSVYRVGQADGSDTVYKITVSIEATRDDLDEMWQPGGNADDRQPGEKSVVVDGVLYVMRPESDDSRWRGFGGRKFGIDFLDGRRMTTTNLWLIGTIPPKWRERWPDNARFATTTA